MWAALAPLPRELAQAHFSHDLSTLITFKNKNSTSTLMMFTVNHLKWITDSNHVPQQMILYHSLLICSIYWSKVTAWGIKCGRCTAKIKINNNYLIQHFIKSNISKQWCLQCSFYFFYPWYLMAGSQHNLCQYHHSHMYWIDYRATLKDLVQCTLLRYRGLRLLCNQS